MMTPYHHGDVKEAAVRATVDMVRRSGAPAVTVRMVAAEVGVSHAALYRHVHSVDDLLDEAAARFLRHLTQDASPQESVEAFLRRYIDRAIADPHHYRLAFDIASDPDRTPLTAAALQVLRRHATGVFADAWPHDSPSATRHRVLRTWATAHGMVNLALLGLVGTRKPSDMARYITRSALTAAAAV